MIRVSKKLKYVFENVPHMYFEDDDFRFRSDKMCYSAFKKYEIPDGLSIDDCELVHLDGNIENCALDNLELVVFDEEDYILKLKNEMKLLKKELVSKDDKIRKLTFDCNAKDGRVNNMHKQVLYEQNRVKELNKEIKTMEKENRRLFAIINSKSKGE